MSALGPRYASAAFGARNETLKAKRVKYIDDDLPDDSQDVEAALDALKAAITAVEADLTGITAADVAYTNPSLTGPPTNVEEALDTIVTDLGLLQTAIDATDLAVDGLNTEVGTLDGRIDTLEAADLINRVGTLETTDVSLDGRIDTLEATATSLDSRIDTLEAAGSGYVNEVSFTCGASTNTTITTLTAVASTAYSIHYWMQVMYSEATTGSVNPWQYYHGNINGFIRADGTTLSATFPASGGGSAIPYGSTASFEITTTGGFRFRFTNATANPCKVKGKYILTTNSYP